MPVKSLRLKFEECGLLEVLTEKLVSNVRLNERGCWVWMGAKVPTGYKGVYKNEYGYIKVRGKRINARRISFILYKKMDPGRFAVDCTCRNCLCVNPNHLTLSNRRKGGR